MSADREETMKESHLCVREVLADGMIATIERCRCGTLHLTLGALTLRLHEDALRSLSGTLLEAAEALAGPRRDRCEALPSGLLGAPIRGAS